MESECKESLLAYYFLLAADKPLQASELDARIEDWLAQHWHCKLDFEVGDALGKLRVLGLAEETEEKWTVLDGK